MPTGKHGSVAPAKAGAHEHRPSKLGPASFRPGLCFWIPACAGMTAEAPAHRRFNECGAKASRGRVKGPIHFKFAPAFAPKSVRV